MHAAQENLQKLMPVLVYIQTHLDEELSLSYLAEAAGLSEFYFHRLFLERVGETPKVYVQRLRLERAAYQLKIWQGTILDIALNNGYQHHETFSRAFKRWFGVSPQQYRYSYGRTWRDQTPSQQPLNRLITGYTLSRLTVQRLSPIAVAFIRNLGAYIDVDTTYYDRLWRWADSKGLCTGDNLLIGVGHDDPAITPADRVRFDVCISVPERFLPEGEIGYQALPGGHYAVASYTGPFGSPLIRAYDDFFVQLTQLKGVEIIGLPVIEIYRMTRVNPAYVLNHIDIYVPVVNTADGMPR